MKLLIDNKEDNREWKLIETYTSIAGSETYSVYEEVLPNEVVIPTSEKVDDYWNC